VFDACVELTAEYSAIEERLADPAVHADPSEARRLARRHAELRPTIEAYRTWAALGDDMAAARELADVDPAFAEEAEALEVRRQEVGESLRELLIPRDPLDGKDVILEIKAGEGGEESALFAGDLLRMYLRYADQRGWSAEVLEAEESDLGGYRDVAVAVKARGIPEPG
jgi:peptide chain release factor 1